MALVLSVCSLKGGSGRTTVATNIAATLAAAGHSVALVDADEGQASATSWGVVGRVCPVVPAGKDIARTLRGLSADVVVIDGPPRLGVETRGAMAVSDFVVVPSVPGATDAWALRQTVALLGEARKVRPDLRAGVVWNRVERTTLARQAQASAEGLEVAMLDTALRSRVTFGEALIRGEGVVTYAPESDAAAEVRRLVKEILREAGGGEKARA